MCPRAAISLTTTVPIIEPNRGDLDVLSRYACGMNVRYRFVVNDMMPRRLTIRKK